MLIRRPTLNDLQAIKSLAQNDDLPVRFVEAGVVEDSGSIIAFGAIRSNMEAIFYPSGTTRQKLGSLKLLLEQAEESTKRHDYDYLDVLAHDNDFAKILTRHFGFKAVEGIVLVKKL